MLSPLVFIAVLDLISRKTAMKIDAMRKLLYVDDMSLVRMFRVMLNRMNMNSEKLLSEEHTDC